MKKMALIAAVAVASLSVRAAVLDWNFPATSSELGKTVYLVTGIGNWENESQLASAAVDSAEVVKISNRAWGTKDQKATIDSANDAKDMYAVMVDPSNSGKFIAKSLGDLSSYVYNPDNQEQSPGLYNQVTVAQILSTGTSSPWYVPPQPIPEPTSVALLALGLAALGLKRRVA